MIPLAKVGNRGKMEVGGWASLVMRAFLWELRPPMEGQVLLRVSIDQPLRLVFLGVFRFGPLELPCRGILESVAIFRDSHVRCSRRRMQPCPLLGSVFLESIVPLT